MRILFLNGWLHFKNLNGLNMLKEYHTIDTVNINLHIKEEELNKLLNSINLSEYDIIYSPSLPIDVKKYPNSKFMFGPHFCTISLDENLANLQLINEPNSIYIQPSEWSKNLLLENTSQPLKIKMTVMPFAVDINQFNEIKPFSEKNKIFLYYKSRHPHECQLLVNFLNRKNIGYPIQFFSYQRRYDESEYLECLQNSKYGIWLDAHESQGFALQEALSCNVPLFVWNATSLKQEYGGSHGDIPGTTLSYWDERCGEFFTNFNEIESKFDLFLSKLEQYKPREYILENLSAKKCSEILNDVINL